VQPAENWPAKNVPGPLDGAQDQRILLQGVKSRHRGSFATRLKADVQRRPKSAQKDCVPHHVLQIAPRPSDHRIGFRMHIGGIERIRRRRSISTALIPKPSVPPLTWPGSAASYRLTDIPGFDRAKAAPSSSQDVGLTPGAGFTRCSRPPPRLLLQKRCGASARAFWPRPSAPSARTAPPSRHRKFAARL
jgi:hypothetical protein